MSVSEKRPRRWLGGKVYLSCYIVTTVILLAFGGFFLGYFIEGVIYRKSYDFDNPVTAVYTDIGSTRTNYSNTRTFFYYPIYEYTSPDGVHYRGHVVEHYSKSKAESFLGKEVLIYINGKGGSTVYSYKDKKIWAAVLGPVLLTAGLADLFVLAIPHRWKPSKCDSQKTPTLNFKI